MKINCSSYKDNISTKFFSLLLLYYLLFLVPTQSDIFSFLLLGVLVVNINDIKRAIFCINKRKKERKRKREKGEKGIIIGANI